MGQQLKGLNDNMTYEVKSRTIKRLRINTFYFTTGGATLMPAMQNVRITGTLRRGGRERVIFSDTLRALLLESNFMTTGECVYNDGAGIVMSIVGGVTNFFIPGIIDLKMPINLKGDDEFVVEANMSSSWIPTGGTASSYMDFQWRDDIGVEKYIPRINSRSIQAGSTKWDEDLGDNVTQVSFISIPPTAVGGSFLTDATAVITNLKISSDRYDVNDNHYAMIARRQTLFETKATAENRYRSFQYPFEKECDQVRVEMLLNSANVAAGEQVVMWRSFEIDPGTYIRSEHMEAKHDQKDGAKLAKVGL